MSDEYKRDKAGLFAKGNKGGGRKPNHIRLDSLVQRLLDDEVETKAGKLTKLEVIFKKQIHEAMTGDLKAAIWVIERAYGRAPIEVVGVDDSRPVVTAFQFTPLEDDDETLPEEN